MPNADRKRSIRLRDVNRTRLTSIVGDYIKSGQYRPTILYRGHQLVSRLISKVLDENLFSFPIFVRIFFFIYSVNCKNVLCAYCGSVLGDSDWYRNDYLRNNAH
jgi:hypothetical protein